MMTSKLREDSLTKLKVSPMIFQNGHLDSNMIHDLLLQTPNPDVKTLELIGLPIAWSIATAVLNLLQLWDWERVSLVGCTGRDLFTLFNGLSRVHTLHLTGLAIVYKAFCALSMALHVAPMLKTLSFTWCSLQPGIGPLSEAFSPTTACIQVSKN
jgi:hypothetical protein